MNLVETQREQKIHEERLAAREAELYEREKMLRFKEIEIQMKHLQAQQLPVSVMTPTPKKRKNFRKRLLKKESSNSMSSMISGPSGK